jgi:3-oxoadipate enol-lactonase
MRFVKANGLVIHYRDHGRRDGAPLVFINSLGTDFRIWNEVAEILAPHFRIITYDKRGHGLSESGPDKNDMADYARDLAALLDQVGVGRATIVGLSIGGLIAQELYRLSPERAMLTRTPRQGYLAACGALKRADLRPYAGLIEAPTLCLVGDQDGSTPVALVRETAALIPGSRFEIIEGAGHLPNVERPEIVAKLVVEHARRAAA